MDKDTRLYLRSAFQYLEKHQEMLQQVMIVTFALRKTIRELGPEAEKIYARHYQAEMLGPLKPESDQLLKSLGQLLTQLTDVN